MNRRAFLFGLGLGAPALTAAQVAPPANPPAKMLRPPEPSRIESLTPNASPAIALNHLGFVPKGLKILVYRQAAAVPAEYTLRDFGRSVKPLRVTRPLTKIPSDFGDCLVGDFSDIEAEGLYEISVGNERSVPFLIRPDVWRRTLPKAVSYIHSQRCGVAVPNMHAACHLDDARRRDTGEHVDVAGGWHSAGSLVKTGTTMMNGLGLLHLARNLGERWDPAGSGLRTLLDEMRWGNAYFLKLQDRDGLIWQDVGAGSWRYWTDNTIGSSDDRDLNTSKSGLFQAMFITLQAMAAQAFRNTDPGYSQRCLAAAVRCWDAAREAAKLGRDLKEFNWWTFTTELSWRLLSAVELHRASGRDSYQAEAESVARQLLSLQTRDFIGAQKTVRGFWRASADDPSPTVDPVYSAIPALAFLELSLAFPKHMDVGRWRDAVRLHLDEYVLPLTARSAFRIVPYGIFLGSPTPEHYRPLSGELTYRYFMPVRKQWWWLGTTAHLECYALLLAMAAKAFGRREYRDLAYRQLEWVMGANPFGACLMTGEGARKPYGYNAFLGPIPGGILNGIAGNTRDEPVLDNDYGYAPDTWRTREYWSPHNAFYLWGLSVLEGA